jgi:hypothetical protein
MRSFDNRMFESASLKPAAWVPVPAISMAVMPVNVVIDVDIVDPVRLSVLAER